MRRAASTARSPLQCAANLLPLTSIAEIQHTYRLVLGLVSEYFRTMFTMSGMEESQNRLSGGGGAAGTSASGSITTMSMTTIDLPDFATYNGVLCMLRYLYTGAADGGDIKVFHPADADKCALVCQLLQLSDLYLLDHLKQWCEVYLGAEEVLNVYVLYWCASAPSARSHHSHRHCCNGATASSNFVRLPHDAADC